MVSSNGLRVLIGKDSIERSGYQSKCISSPPSTRFNGINTTVPTEEEPCPFVEKCLASYGQITSVVALAWTLSLVVLLLSSARLLHRRSKQQFLMPIADDDGL